MKKILALLCLVVGLVFADGLVQIINPQTGDSSKSIIIGVATQADLTAGLATKLNTNQLEQVVSTNADKVASSAAVKTAIENATPIATLQSVLTAGATATNSAAMAIGTTNTMLGKVTIVGEGLAYTNKPLLYLKRSVSGTGNMITCIDTNGNPVSGINSAGNRLDYGIANGTNYVYTMSIDPTNNFYTVTKAVYTP